MKRNTISVQPIGYRLYRISMMYRKREISCVTTNIEAVNNYQAPPNERCFRNWPRKRVNIGYETLRRDLINSIKLNTKTNKPV
jgi:hypothetical protein